MTEPNIILHIGAPKTGSTYLQNRLRSAAEHLRSHGLHYPLDPIAPRMAANSKTVAMAIDQRASINFRRAYPAVSVPDLHPSHIVDELLRGWRDTEERVILSAENLRPHHARALHDILPVAAKVLPVMFVRRQDDWCESYFNQKVKGCETGGDFDTFLAQVADPDNTDLCHPNWLAHASAWRAVFGSCQVVSYDLAKSDLLDAFWIAAGLGGVPQPPDAVPDQVSVDLHQLAYLAEHVQRSSFSEFRLRRTASGQASEVLRWNEPYTLLSQSERDRIAEFYATSNDAVVREFCRADDADGLAITPVTRAHRTLGEHRGTKSYDAYRQLADDTYEALRPRLSRRVVRRLKGVARGPSQ